MKASQILFFVGLAVLLAVIVITLRDKEENILEINLEAHKNLCF